MSYRLRVVSGSVALALTVSGPAFANEFEPQLKQYLESELRAIASDPAIVAAVEAQNAKTGAMDQAAIDKADAEWRAEVSAASKPLIDEVLKSPASAKLKAAQAASGGVITEAFAMDAKGLNVGMSDVTSDYWQGDEAKWQKTYAVGPQAFHISEVEQDESTQTFQSQVSVPVVSGGKPIGAVTFGVNVELLSK